MSSVSKMELTAPLVEDGREPDLNAYGYVLPNDEAFMQLALQEAQAAYAIGEVPIGAILVRDGSVIGRAHNMRETWHDPTAHAELIVIRDTARQLGTWRLTGCTLYVTIEPCPMCAGALLQSRLTRLVYGASDPKAGAVDTLYKLLQDQRLNHQVQVTHGIRADACGKIMQDFFRRLRT